MPGHWTIAHVTRNPVAITHRSVLRLEDWSNFPCASLTNHVLWALDAQIADDCKSNLLAIRNRGKSNSRKTYWEHSEKKASREP